MTDVKTPSPIPDGNSAKPNADETKLITALAEAVLAAGKQIIKEKPKATADEIRQEVKKSVGAKVSELMDKLVGQILIKEPATPSEAPTVVATPDAGWCVVM